MARLYRLLLIVASFVLLSGGFTQANDSFEDVLLAKVIEAYQLTPHKPVIEKHDPLSLLGRALFFDPILSGPRNIACATCHIRSKGAGDGLSLAVGLGAKGVGKERLAQEDAIIVPRNTLPLFNRGSVDFRAFFWDGRVQLGPHGEYESPLGDILPNGFNDLLAVASVFPLVEPDEMLGHSRRRVESQAQHHELVTIEGIDNNYQERAQNAFRNIISRILDKNQSEKNGSNTSYRELFRSAFPNSTFEQLDITHVGNALSSYIRLAFDLRPAPWDLYLDGDKDALDKDQKLGALIFYGKGRCVLCHSGKEFSDFLFHGIAIPQQRIGKHSPYEDYGRAVATSRAEDRYNFRTPPLRNAISTGPWGHNGSFKSLESIIEHHGNPVPVLYKAQVTDPIQGHHAGRLLGNRSRILAEMAPLQNVDIRRLIAFLGALSSHPVLPEELALPKNVPSGNPEFINR